MIWGTLIAILFASWGEEYQQAIRAYAYLHGEMFSQGWFVLTESGEVEVHPLFTGRAEYSDYLEYVDRLAEAAYGFTMYADADDIPQALINEYTAYLNGINTHMAGFMGIGMDQIPEPVPKPEGMEEGETPPQASFQTASITALGDQQAIDRVRFNIQNIQGFYDTISGLLEAGSYDLASRNVRNLSGSLVTLGEEVAALRGQHSISITFHGLPGDGAMEARAELQRLRESNYRLWEYAQKTTQDLDDAILAGDMAYIRLIWRTSLQSMLDWHSPPDWYQVPSTFRQWYNDSEERAGAILNAMQTMERLRQTRNEFDRIRSTAENTHRETVAALEGTEPLVQIHGQLATLFRGLSWAVFSEE